MKPTEKSAVEMFGGADRIIHAVASTISALCRARGWGADELASQAFPATARQAKAESETSQSQGGPARQELERFRTVAQSLLSGPAGGQSRRLPPSRIVLAFLDALGVPLQNVLEMGHLSEDDARYWATTLQSRGVGAIHSWSSTGRPPDDIMRAMLETMLRLDALAAVCEPEPPPSANEQERRRKTREQVRRTLGLPATP